MLYIYILYACEIKVSVRCLCGLEDSFCNYAGVLELLLWYVHIYN